MLPTKTAVSSLKGFFEMNNVKLRSFVSKLYNALKAKCSASVHADIKQQISQSMDTPYFALTGELRVSIVKIWEKIDCITTTRLACSSHHNHLIAPRVLGGKE